MTKNTIKVRLEGTTELYGIAWYGNLNVFKVEGEIKKLFNLQKNARIILRDQENCVIILTNFVPPNEAFTVTIPVII